MERIRMDRVNAILKHKTYRKYYDQIEKIEKDRIFCRHQMPHLLDVARIAYITNLERNLGYDREVIYAAAILHDIGKSFQYEERIPHETRGKSSFRDFGILPEGLASAEKDSLIWRQSGSTGKKKTGQSRSLHFFMTVTSVPVPVFPARQKKSATGRMKRRTRR